MNIKALGARSVDVDHLIANLEYRVAMSERHDPYAIVEALSDGKAVALGLGQSRQVYLHLRYQELGSVGLAWESPTE